MEIHRLTISHVKNTVFTGLYAVPWKTKYTLIASKGIQRERSNQVLVIKCTWLTHQQQVCASIKEVVLASSWCEIFRCVLTECHNLPRSGEIVAQNCDAQKICKILRAIVQTLQVSVSKLNGEKDGTSVGCLESVLSLKRTWQNSLGFQSCIWTKPEDFCSNVLGVDQTKVEISGCNAQYYFWWKTNTACQNKQFIQFWRADDLGFFCSHRNWAPWSHRASHGLLRIPVFQSQLMLTLGQNWVMQQGNDPKHSSKSTTECANKKRMEVFRWPRETAVVVPVPELCINECTQTSMNWINAVKKIETKFLHNDVKNR